MPYTRDEVKKYLDEIEDLLVNSRKVNGDITSVDRLINQAKQLFERGELEDTMTYLNEARDRLNEIYAQGAKEQLSFLRGLTSAIKNTGIDPKELREYLKNTRTFFENKDYIMAYKTAAEGMNFATQLIQKDPVLKQNIYKSRQKFGLSEGFLQKLEKVEESQTKVEIPERTEKVYLLETKLKMAKDAGIDVSGIKEDLESMDKLLVACDEKLTAILNEKMKEKLNAYQQKVAEFKKDGMDVGKIEESLNSLAERIEELSFEDLFGELKTIDEALQHPDLYISVLKKRIEILKEMGVDVKEFDTALGQAQLFRTDGNLASASAIAREAFLKITSLLTEKMKQTIETIEQLCGYAVSNRLKGITRDSHRQILDSYTRGDFSACASQIKDLNIKLENAFKEHIKDKISALNVRMNVARNMGVPMPGIENALQNVREKISAREYLEAIKLLEDMEQKCEADMQKYREVNDLMGDLDKKLQALMAAGVDAQDIQELFSKVIELKNSDINAAINVAKMGIQKVDEKLKGVQLGLDIEFRNDLAERGAQCGAELVIKNTGNVAIKDLKIETSATVTGLRQNLPVIRAGAREVLRFKMALDKEKVTFKITAPNPLKNEPFVLTREFSLAVKEEKKPEAVAEKKEEPKPAAEPVPAVEKKPEAEAKTFVKKTADAVYQCVFCRGKIKQGLPIIVCECGATYHEPCASRIGVCQKCKKPIK
ncbi:MAG: PHD finger domain-containing protein [Thermoplasmata archaeon]|nr:PHD finger domain-containing protein [Thermoplasmata archaeon]